MLTATKASFTPRKYSGNDVFRGYASVDLGDMIQIRDISVIGDGSHPVVDMPSRPYRVLCPNCNRPANIAYRYCPRCGIPRILTGCPPDSPAFVPVVRVTGMGLLRSIEDAVRGEVHKAEK